VVLEEVESFYRGQPWTAGRHMRIVEGSPTPALISDRTLVGRILGNMLKNALEAARQGDTVTLGCAYREEATEFSVHNPQVMPEEVQRQVFQRSFSTKGKGRGLGTYGMKLIAERYLRGRVSFDSAPEKGTTFRARFPRLPGAL
jgi:signal transduction histidine kinase